MAPVLWLADERLIVPSGCLMIGRISAVLGKTQKVLAGVDAKSLLNRRTLIYALLEKPPNLM